MPPDHERLRAIKTFPQLVKYLRDDLEWPIDTDSFEELTFEYEPEELGLDLKSLVKIKPNGIKQLRPLESKQPWGIFFIDFEPKRLPVVVLRRILRALVVKKRQSANRSQQAVWKLHDLLFISSYGESDHRDITFAHFSEDSSTLANELPTLRVLGWDDEDTAAHLAHAHQTLSDKLHWPPRPIDLDDWRKTWSSAFTLRHREVITTSKDLAVRMAQLATAIRKRANKVLSVESESGPLRKLMSAFREALIHDLSEDDFADMYAQTITYGLLSARVSRHTPDAPAALEADNLTDMVPVTNPFLKDLLGMFLTVGGRKGKIDFDELGINDVVDALRAANMAAVLRDFDDRNPEEDPVIHFYELFLKEYDPKKRMQRGVFYTPKPVVSYIVRSVHELLQTEFGLNDGLADTTTWGDVARKHKDLKLPEIEVVDPKTRKVSKKPIDPGTPFVQILDPATGTATFLVEVIDIIHKTMVARWKKQGHTEMFDIPRLWNEYVPRHLLPRLYGYELMMAPYAIAHMKIGLKLFETGYKFDTGERARIYLTNALEPPQDFSDTFEQMAPALAHEAQAVNDVKRHQRFTVVIGNPPYSVKSYNNGEWIRRVLGKFKRGLNETKINLDDDFIKFVCYASQQIEDSNTGAVGMITNNIFLTGVTHRQMRSEILAQFRISEFCNLHGDSRYGEQSPPGLSNENVFDIQQGVCVSILAKPPRLTGRVRYADVWGTREEKSTSLLNRSSITLTDVAPTAPYYLLAPQSGDESSVYETWPRLSDWMPVYSNGIETHKDSLTIHFSQAELRRTVEAALSDTVENVRYNLEVGDDGRDWKLSSAIESLRSMTDASISITKITYRPFDVRFTVLNTESGGFIAYPRWDVMSHLVGIRGNLAVVSARLHARGGGWDSCVLTRYPTEKKTGDSTRSSTIFPLFVADASNLQAHAAVRTNVSEHLVDGMRNCLSIKELPAADLFAYFCALMHSPQYRLRYERYLKLDFPRLPLTSSLDLFRALAKLGGELVALHLMESPLLAKAITTYTGITEPQVEKLSYANGTVWLDKKQTCGFAGVPEAVWSFHIGGYQVCHKWLKDRKGRALSKEDIAHYQKIVVALNETIRIMKEIDETIEKHGGWPGAFVTDKAKVARD